MQAVVFGDRRTIELADRPRPRPGPGEVLLRPLFVGICGTDLHAPTLDHFRPGVVMGHEFSAEVQEVGEGVARVDVGDRVVVNPNGNLCGVCWSCRTGHDNLCRVAVFEAGIGIHVDGGMADRCVVAERTVHRVPDGVSSADAAWTEPAATALRAVRRSAISVGDDAVVLGAGPIGLLTVQLLRRAGIGRLVVIEPSAYRRQMAAALGADETLEPHDDALLDGQAPAFLFECSGAPDALAVAARLARADATIVVVGIAPGDIAVTAFDIIGKELRVIGSIIYTDEFPMALDLLDRGALELAPMTTAIHPLAEFETAFAALQDPSASVKVLLQP